MGIIGDFRSRKFLGKLRYCCENEYVARKIAANKLRPRYIKGTPVFMYSPVATILSHGVITECRHLVHARTVRTSHGPVIGSRRLPVAPIDIPFFRVHEKKKRICICRWQITRSSCAQSSNSRLIP